MSDLFRKQAKESYGRIYGKPFRLGPLRFGLWLALAGLCAAAGGALALRAIGAV